MIDVGQDNIPTTTHQNKRFGSFCVPATDDSQQQQRSTHFSSHTPHNKWPCSVSRIFLSLLLWLVGQSIRLIVIMPFSNRLACAYYDVSPSLRSSSFCQAPTMSNHVALVHYTYSNMFEKTAWATVQDSFAYSRFTLRTNARFFAIGYPGLVHTISLSYISRTQRNEPILKL